tara:strand:+ start:89 stop:517 length:429 start_codon:yes stop_codon:yes gene_type:complete
MIKYKLICKNCDLLFDSWFGSSDEFEKLKKKNFLNCHSCNSKKIEKTLMAPKLMNNHRKDNLQKKDLKFKDINKKLTEYRNFIEKNFDYVGENFAYEARSIHYNNRKRKKGIFGTASNDEIKDLHDEGIQTVVVPWIKDKSN